MKDIVTSEKTLGAIGRPWWQVRRTLWWSLVAVCAAPGVIWLDAEFRAALVAALLLPFAEAVQPLLRVDMLVVLAGSTGAGLLIGWVLRRVRGLRPPETAAQTA